MTIENGKHKTSYIPTMQYKEGDEVTIKLTAACAQAANQLQNTFFRQCEIISHKPAPEPIIGFVDVYENSFGLVKKEQVTALRVALVKLTYDPTTNTASAEVVG